MTNGTVLYIGGFELPDKNAASHRVLSNAKILRDLDYNVVLLGIDKSFTHFNEHDSKKKLAQGFVYYNVLYPRNLFQWLKYMVDISNIQFYLKQYSDIKLIIAYNYPAVALMKLKRAVSNKGIKVIADCTEWYSSKGIGFPKNILKFIDTTLRMRFIHKRLDGLIVISDYLKKYYARHLHVLHLPPLVDLKEEKWSTVRDIDTLRKINSIELAYSGDPSTTKEKLDKIYNILNEISNLMCVTFHIIGISEKEFINMYSNVKLQRKCSNFKIIFHGRLPHYESMKIQKQSDFTVFFRNNSRTNNAGFPTKFVESVSLKIPVITNDFSDIKKYSTMLKGIYIININKQEIGIEQIKQAIYNKDTGAPDSSFFYYTKYTEVFKNFIESIMI